MSDVKVNVSRGKGRKKLTVKFEGIHTRAQWAEFKQKLKALAKLYSLKVSGK